MGLALENKEPTTNTAAGEVQHSLRHSQRKFLVVLSAFVVVISFVYGLVAGFNKKVEATALMDLQARNVGSEAAEPFLLENFDLVPGVELRNVGESQRINAQQSEVLSVLTALTPEQLLERQVALWQQKGYRSFGATTSLRGVALAFDEDSGRRYSMLAWSVPPTLRDVVAEGHPTQALVSFMDEAEAANTQGAEELGQVPGVPLAPGGRSTAVFSAVDRGVRSYSASYTNPGSIQDNQDFYRSELEDSGWNEVRSSSNKFGNSEVGYVLYSKPGQELTLLFAPVPLGTELESKTTVQVSLAMGADDA